MSLITEISLKKEEIEQKSSPLEVLFFNYLSNDSLHIDFGNKSLSNIEKIACNVFTKSDSNLSEIIAKEQKADSTFELHYCNNLIELSAMVLADPDFEQDNLKNYLNKASLKEGFILSRFANDIELTKNLKVADSIDNLVKKSYLTEDSSDYPKIIIEALKQADDLMDVFVIEKCFEKLVDIHPVVDNKKKVVLLFDAIDSYNDKFELKIKRRIFSFIFIVLALIGSLIAYVIPTFWNKYNLEPLTVVTQIVFSFLLLALTSYFFLFHKIEDNKSLLTRYINKRLVKVNRNLNIDLTEINKIREDFKHE